MTDPPGGDAPVADAAAHSRPVSRPVKRSAGAGVPSPSLSIGAMILGILGLVIGFLGGGLIFSVGAVALGHLGRRKEAAARGFWLTGLVAGYVGLVVNLVVIAIWVVVLLGLASAADVSR